MDEAAFQRENFKLREREYRYYAEANRAQLPRIPDLADNAGGLSNPVYFNFVNYCLWKVVYRHVQAPEEREAFARACAADFLSRMFAEAALQQPSAKAAGGGQPEAVVRGVVVPFLDFLRARGYICTYQVVLRGHPGSWPQDWMTSQPTLVSDAEAAAAEEEAAEPGPAQQSAAGTGATAGAAADEAAPSGDFLFQLKLHRPADILGSVALRSEEGGAWPHTVSSCLFLLLEPLGYRATQQPSSSAAAAGTPAAPSVLPSQPGRPLAAPSSGAAAAAAEVSFEAECEEYFYQDVWQGPTSLRDRLLLLLGDPLEQVGVDSVPTTLVQNWRLRGRAV